MQFLSQQNQEIQILVVTLASLVFGSFATLLTYRLITKEPIILGRSKCPSCNTVLRSWNLIPLFSFLFQRGKCVFCQKNISLRYPLIELSFLISFLTIYFVLPNKFDAKMLLYFLIAATLIIMVVVDLEHYFIPDSMQYFLAIITAILVILESGTSGALINIKSAILYAGFGLALYAFFRLTTGLEAIGIDDIKFLFIAGLMLGTSNFLAFILLSGVFGLMFGAVWTKIKKEKTFPFAPALCLATFLCLLFEKKINPVDLFGSMLFFQAL